MNIDSKPNVNLYIVGFMGTGKSTIGQELANLMKMDFFDSDHEIKRTTGVDIPLIFEIEGETGFRKRETKIISELVL